MKGKLTITQLKCPICRSVRDIPRKSARRKKNGHIKHMMCFRCKKVRGFVESGM